MQHASNSIEEGLVGFAQIIGDTRMAQAAGAVYRDVSSAINPMVAEDDDVELAFIGMIVRTEVRTECLVVITNANFHVAWRKGLFKKKNFTQSIPRSSITQVVVGAGQGHLGQTTLLTVSSTESECVVALARDAPAFHTRVAQTLGS